MNASLSSPFHNPKHRTGSRTLATGLLVTCLLLPTSFMAQAQTAAPSTAPLGGLGSGKDPIKIDADRLDVFDNEKRATFTGNVVAVQGDTTMRCSALNVFYEQSAAAASGNTPPAASGGDDNNNIRKLDCMGPVTVVSKEQTATGQHAVFDRSSNTVTLTGNVALSQDKNVQQCDQIVYNLDTSIANCIAKRGGRVQGVFVPGGGNAAKSK